LYQRDRAGDRAFGRECLHTRSDGGDTRGVDAGLLQDGVVDRRRGAQNGGGEGKDGYGVAVHQIYIMHANL
jgi:hypothetical protein